MFGAENRECGFDPSAEEYKTVADLPEDQQGKYADAEGGFITKEASNYQKLAEIAAILHKQYARTGEEEASPQELLQAQAELDNMSLGIDMERLEDPGPNGVERVLEFASSVSLTNENFVLSALEKNPTIGAGARGRMTELLTPHVVETYARGGLDKEKIYENPLRSNEGFFGKAIDRMQGMRAKDLFEFASDDLKGDKQFILNFMEHTQEYYRGARGAGGYIRGITERASEGLRSDRDFIKEACRKTAHPHLLPLTPFKEASAELRSDPEFVSSMLDEWPDEAYTIIANWPKDRPIDEDILKKAIELEPDVLRLAEQMKNDKQVVDKIFQTEAAKPKNKRDDGWVEAIGDELIEKDLDHIIKKVKESNNPKLFNSLAKRLSMQVWQLESAPDRLTRVKEAKDEEEAA